MPADRLSRHLLIAFALAAGLYAVAYTLIEGRRARHTPWVVEFTPVSAASQLRLVIRQASLGLGPVEVRVPLAAPVPDAARVEFGDVRPVPFPVPGGQCVFHDATFMPGTVVLDFDGVKVQLLRRVLTVGTNEFPWHHPEPISARPP